MNKILLVTAFLLTCNLSSAQSTTTPAQNNNTISEAGGGGGFDQVKQRHLARISERLAKLQQTQSCIQAATNFEALKACRPEQSQHHNQ